MTGRFAFLVLIVFFVFAGQNDSGRDLRVRAQRGDAVAQFELGNVYASGDGVPQNDTEAVKWYRLSAIQSDDLAHADLGDM